MSKTPDDSEFDPVERESAEADPDTNLILDYLANKLDPEDAGKLEERARRDKDFRYKLADLVLLKGLVMLALEKNPAPAARECRRTQRMFLDYLKGRTSAQKTAELSRHLEDCFECELAFERFQDHPFDIAAQGRGGRAGWLRRVVHPGRSLAITAVVALVLAAGAVGMVGFLSSASASPGTHGLAGPGGTVAEAGLIQRPDEVRQALSDLTISDPSLAVNGRMEDLVENLLAEPSPHERAQLYATLGNEFRPHVEPVLWALAANEPIERARSAAYAAIGLEKTTSVDALFAATRREASIRSGLAHQLLYSLAAVGESEIVEYLRRLFAEDPQHDEWWCRGLYMLHGRKTGDAVIAGQMTSALSDPSELVRSFAALAAANARNHSGLPVALGLVDSTDSAVRLNTALAIARLGDQADLDRLFDRRWARETRITGLLEPTLKARGLALPKNL